LWTIQQLLGEKALNFIVVGKHQNWVIGAQQARALFLKCYHNHKQLLIANSVIALGGSKLATIVGERVQNMTSIGFREALR
jgi:hypothetical protein